MTELVTGVDLVELQLLVAEGRPLPDEALEPRLCGHAIEARLYAEDPARDFLPATGTLSRFRIGGDVRVDGGVEDGSSISPHYDPMIAKVVAHASTRAAAARKLADALARAQLHGITTNRDFLVRVLRHPEFLSGRADTSFLDRHPAGELAAPLLDDDATAVAAAAAALALQAGRRAAARVLATLPTGWRNNHALPQRAVLSLAERELVVEYAFDRDARLLTLQVDGADLAAPVLHRCTADRVELEVDGVRHVYAVHVDRDGPVFLNGVGGQVAFEQVPRFADPTEAEPEGSLRSPMPGSVIRVLVEDTASVDAGQPLLVLEAMKMEQEIVAPRGGVVSLRVQEGSHVEAGAVLAVVEEE